MIELLRTRRSIRQYTRQPIEAEKIELLKEALLRAPSSRSLRPWKFIFVNDPALLTQLAQTRPHGSQLLENAPLAIIIGGDERQSDVWVEDCSIAAIFVQLTAHSLGLGSCWIQIRNRRHNTDITAEAYIQELLNLPAELRLECIISLGYPAEHKAPIPREELHFHKINLNYYKD